MIRLCKLSKSYDTPVIETLSYDFPDTGLVLLRGPSGTGKTTLLRLIAGLEEPTSGRIEGLEGKTVSVAFQEARLVPHLTLLENVLLVGKTRDRERALALLDRLGLKKDADRFPHELSGGMRQRGALARSLYFGGEVYLWDEPTAELDEKNRRIVSEILDELAKGALVIVSSHDPALISDTVLSL